MKSVAFVSYIFFPVGSWGKEEQLSELPVQTKQIGNGGNVFSVSLRSWVPESSSCQNSYCFQWVWLLLLSMDFSSAFNHPVLLTIQPVSTAIFFHTYFGIFLKHHSIT